MKAFTLSGITRQHVLQAIREIDLRHPELNSSTVYDVVYRGKRYPPLELMRLAYKMANGTAEWALSAGVATNAYLERMGFAVVQKRPLFLSKALDIQLPPIMEQEQVALQTPEEVLPTLPVRAEEPIEFYAKRKVVERYTLKKALAEIFISEEQLSNIRATLQQKKNIILQGPPGTGKTFLARRLAYLGLGYEDVGKVQTIQFHASFAYEDFIQGYRPDGEGKFVLMPGVFQQFCEKAKANPDTPYFFIIEEINRGNLRNIFGELLLLLEADKRGKEFAVALPSGGTPFYVPENLFVIGTMNTADQALVPLDFALRRRFGFAKMEPAFNTHFRRFLEYRNTPDALIDLIFSKLVALNKEIELDSYLGEGFRIGHSYFCHPPKSGGDINWYTNLVQHELAPLLEEYWSEKPAKAKEAIRMLLDI
ncbi:AAA family ATPase [Adhaeribacter aquaticus]|uniref:AAA family ATPase n=1 Tax=Adhaeribacter aquaticus TaxID=299567 RepID=UPI000400F9DE|nr:AAA family ATPase [Adhaeribacter aquaticus]